MPTTMTIRLEPELKQRLDQQVEWQIQETQRAIMEADTEEFASVQEVASIVNKWIAGANRSDNITASR